MKRAGHILSLVIIFVMMTTAFCLAATAADEQQTGSEGGLILEDTYPKDGSKGASIENMSVKLYFSSEFTEKVLKKSNDGAIQLIGPEGEELPTRVLYSTKEKGVVLVIVDNDKEGKIITGEGNSEYTLKVSGSFKDDKGNTLGQDKTIKFTTLNQKVNTMVNMLLMFVMFGGIMVISMRGAKKEAERQQNAAKNEKVNPYKEAKRTGKSVEEIVERDQRNKAKQAEKAAKKAAREAEEAEDYDDYIEEGVYRVKSPRPIAAAGGKYITGRKAAAEAKKSKGKKK
ncbi:MAG: Ig-like domain-containing protein [Anaerovoracaceae bacterium]